MIFYGSFDSEKKSFYGNSATFMFNRKYRFYYREILNGDEVDETT